MSQTAEQLTFNLSAAIELKNQGIRQVAENNEHFLFVARNIARSLAECRIEITSDDVRRSCPIEPLHPNAWGAVWKHKDFVWTGKYRQSRVVSRHGGMQRVWRIRSTA